MNDTHSIARFYWLADEIRGYGRELRIEAMREVARDALDAIPCTCHEAYIKRRLEDPGCSHHDLVRALDYAWDCECGCRQPPV